MTRFSQKQYEWRVLAAMAVYSAFLLYVWPMVRTTDSYPFKVLLGVAPALPVIYVLAQLARRIRASDELEQRTHLIALGVAMGVVGALSLVGGFLSIAGVLRIDGSILIWVFPVMMLTYGATRWWVLRGYGGVMSCDDGTNVWLWLRFVLIGAVVLVMALMHPPGLDGFGLGFIYGTGIGLLALGLVVALRQWFKRRLRHH
ncbi:hypothetical protein [Dyella psychrodurans]|uniref:Uncharacterized protein n=1 Tax=Dyella psychrodurans TaxID=1927960 RepID=A0A370X4N5_9GAMM|nr:hypothetical protein [Dyella psychrodurans]RDS83230.1 hypothetical protein DWU99_11820 [Dyella psychrodurans]